MSFGESIFSVGFIQKTVKVDLDVRLNHVYPERKGHQKTLEDSRGLHAEAESEGLLGGAAQPLGPPISLRVAMSVLHRLLGCIYAIP